SLRQHRGQTRMGAQREHAPAQCGDAAAHELLQRLGALTGSGGITALGRRMLALGTHPRLAAMLAQAG
ncbi:hypothetical protein, partial [Xanthomonas arboricola]|uniref:hypothetical protein n=1 Tax=Xanthomonas arboricola TaxID=56448 RepID=UPI002157CEFD